MDCLFCRIITRDIPGDIVFENDDVIAFRDVAPQAPTHVLVVPKKHIETIDHAGPEDEALLGKLILAGQKVAAQEGLSDDGYRLVFNVNNAGGQAVYHIHLHVIGGRQMTWPPG
jgi:histidine triad (HIT) family protein